MREKIQLTVAKQPLLAKKCKNKIQGAFNCPDILENIYNSTGVCFRNISFFLLKQLIIYFRDSCHNYIKFHQLKLILECH